MKKMIAICLLLASCSTQDENWLSRAQRPIVVVAVSGKGSVILRSADNKHFVIPPGYALSDAIAFSYSAGDTLK